MKDLDVSLLTRLSDAFAPSGSEDEIRKMIIPEVLPYVDTLKVDGIGNLIATKGDAEKLAVCAHMDEVGFMISEILEDGTLRFGSVGGLTPATLPSKRVLIGRDRVLGVIGAKPIHLSKNEKNEIGLSDLYIHVGVFSKAEAEKIVSVGDFAVFDTKCRVNEKEDVIIGKALDNRLGCYLLIQLIKSGCVENGTFVFTVQEECGLRGAKCFAEAHSFDIAVALDTTTANDLPSLEGPEAVCKLKHGPVISYIDGATVYDRDLVKYAFSLLEKEKVTAQTKMRRAGGNDASALQKSSAGHKVLSLSVPCRYIHGPAAFTTVSDLKLSEKALEVIAQRLSSSERW